MNKLQIKVNGTPLAHAVGNYLRSELRICAHYDPNWSHSILVPVYHKSKLLSLPPQFHKTRIVISFFDYHVICSSIYNEQYAELPSISNPDFLKILKSHLLSLCHGEESVRFHKNIRNINQFYSDDYGGINRKHALYVTK